LLETFAGIKFRGWASLIDFAGIKFREWQKFDFYEIKLCMSGYFLRILIGD